MRGGTVCGDGLACGGHGERWDDGRGGRASLSWSAQRPSARHFCLPPFKRVARFIFRQAPVEHEPIGQTIYYIHNPLSHAPSLVRLTLLPSAARLTASHYSTPRPPASAVSHHNGYCTSPPSFLGLRTVFSVLIIYRSSLPCFRSCAPSHFSHPHPPLHSLVLSNAPSLLHHAVPTDPQ